MKMFENPEMEIIKIVAEETNIDAGVGSNTGGGNDPD